MKTFLLVTMVVAFFFWVMTQTALLAPYMGQTKMKKYFIYAEVYRQTKNGVDFSQPISVTNVIVDTDSLDLDTENRKLTQGYLNAGWKKRTFVLVIKNINKL